LPRPRPIPGRSPLQALPALLAAGALLLLLVLAAPAGPAAASLTDDRYDGNIFALYAGNGSLVPPASSLAQALQQGRVAVLVFYLDDSASSKRFAPVVSELQRIWSRRIDLIPLVTDPLQNRPAGGPEDPARYWSGSIPQVVVIDGEGRVRFDATGQVSVDAINAAVADATGLTLPERDSPSTSGSFNELNSEILPSR
jgi:hypothetical protein